MTNSTIVLKKLAKSSVEDSFEEKDRKCIKEAEREMY